MAKIEWKSGAGDQWCIRADQSTSTPSLLWLDIRVGPVVLGTHIDKHRALDLAAMLLAAAGHEDPIPTPETTESDFGAFVEAAQ